MIKGEYKKEDMKILKNIVLTLSDMGCKVIHFIQILSVEFLRNCVDIKKKCITVCWLVNSGLKLIKYEN